MKLDRLWQTLVFFDVIPFVNCFKKLLGKSSQYTNQKLKKMNKILITDTEDNLVKLLINSLLSNNYSVKLLTQNLAQAQENYDSRIEIIEANINSAENLDSQVWEGVNKVICLQKEGLNNFISQVIKNLPQQETILFDFTQDSLEVRETWGAVDDVVMGGVSQSNLKLAQSKAVFSGNVSTANNGGFASVRTKNFNPPWDLSAYEGIQLRVKGDGKRYKFITRCEGKWDGIGYCYSFDTLYDYWLTINIPFTDLIPVFRAKTVREAGNFDASKVYSMQLMLSKFEYDGQYNPKFDAGLFALEIESIKTYGHKKLPQLILINNNGYDQILDKSNLNYQVINSENIFMTEEDIVEKCMQTVRI